MKRLAMLALLTLTGCARGWGPGPSPDVPSKKDEEIERIRAERKAGKCRDIRKINPMGGG